MNKEQTKEILTIDMNNLTETEREQLLTLVTKANKGKSKVYTPEYGEEYWIIVSSGELNNYIWKSDFIDFDSFAIGNCFKTREEAEFEAERLRIIKELKDYALEHNECEIDWKDEKEKKWYTCYDYLYSTIRSAWTSNIGLSTVYFTSSQIVDNAIKAIGEDRLKKYYFGIKE